MPKTRWYSIPRARFNLPSCRALPRCIGCILGVASVSWCSRDFFVIFLGLDVSRYAGKG